MFEIYGTTNCVLCDKAKTLLTTHEKEFKFIDVAENEDITAAFFKKFVGVKTVPQVCLSDGFHIGGYTELKKWLSHTE